MTPLYISEPNENDEFHYEMPPEGRHPAVCCDVVDLGMQEETFEGKTTSRHKIRIRWQIDKNKSDGTPFDISRKLTATWDERGHMRKLLESWRGKKFTEGEMSRFDLENLIGKQCEIQIMHEPDKRDPDRTWAKVTNVIQAPAGQSLEIKNYTREVDRDYSNGADPAYATGVQEASDDDLPF